MRLRQLVTLGEIVPERSEAVSTPGMVLGSIGGAPITTSGSMHMEHYISAASLRAVLVDLGEIVPLLSGWIDSGVEAAPATTTTTTKAKRGQGPWHRALVLDFCDTILRVEDINPDRPPFTAMDIALAMKQVGLWHRPNDGLPSDESLRRYVAKPDAGGKHFDFHAGNPAKRELPASVRVEWLVRAYEAGQKPDRETGSIRLPMSNFQGGGRQ
ncbi:MAG: hypothetical protein E6Q92_09915 [Burkholderiaceae bacterium]|nr:MAG: hypothetical protein E6Q92_09915 [Burkholderiaceae bacterium]